MFVEHVEYPKGRVTAELNEHHLLMVTLHQEELGGLSVCHMLLRPPAAQQMRSSAAACPTLCMVGSQLGSYTFGPGEDKKQPTEQITLATQTSV